MSAREDPAQKPVALVGPLRAQDNSAPRRIETYCWQFDQESSAELFWSGDKPKSSLDSFPVRSVKQVPGNLGIRRFGEGNDIAGLDLSGKANRLYA